MTDAFQNDPLEPVRQAFSPLGNTVQQFFRQFGPRPAPQAPPNLEQEAQNDGGEPKPPPGQRQPFNWANNALPPGTPPPPKARYQPYIPATVDRAPEQWGQEEQFPNLPQSFEVPGLATGLSQFFGQNGSVPMAQIAEAMRTHPAEFMAGVQKGQHEAAAMAREKLALHIDEMNERGREEMTRYAEVLSAHEALNETTDPSKMFKPVKGKSLMEDLYDTAREIGDIGRPGTLGDLIASGAKPSEVEAFLQARDKRMRDLARLKATVDADTAQASAWDTVPGQKAPAAQAPPQIDPYSGYQAPGAAPTETATVDPNTGQPAPAPAPAPKDKVAGPGAPDTTTPSDEAPQLTPHEALVNDAVHGKEPTAEFAKRFPAQYDKIMLDAAAQKAAVRNIIDHPPQDRSQILPMIRKISPTIAREAGQVLDYTRPASGGTSGTGASFGAPASQYGNLLADIATAVAGKDPVTGNPRWNQGFYQDQQRFRTDQANKTVILRTKDLAPVAERLNNDLRIIEADLKKRGLSANDVNLDGLVRMFANDPKYVGLHSDFVAYNEAYNTIVTAGHNTITGVKLQSEGISPYAPLSTYRNVIKGHMYGVSGMISGLQDLWESYGGRREGMPGGDTPTARDDFRIINEFRDMDYVTGARPGRDIVVHNGVRAHWTGKNQLDRNAQENWEPVD